MNPADYGLLANKHAASLIDHVGMAVRDIDEAQAFYTHELGLTVDGGRIDLGERGAVVQFLRVGTSGVELLMPTSESGALARFIAELALRLRAHPGKAPWATHLDYLRGLLATYVSRSEEIVLALRGLERFTALEAEVEFERFLEVVRRALETLRSEDVLDGRRGLFARLGVNVVAVNSLPGIEFRRL